MVNNLKWDDFRERRAVVVDLYIKAKALAGRCQKMAILAITGLGLKALANRYNHAKVLKTQELKKIFAISRLEYRYKKKLTVRGGLEFKHENYLRYVFGLIRNVRFLEAEDFGGRKNIVPFLKEWFYRQDLKRKFHRGRELLLFIKSRFTAQILMRKSKLLVLEMHWEQQLGKLVAKAGGKDKK